MRAVEINDFYSILGMKKIEGIIKEDVSKVFVYEWKSCKEDKCIHWKNE